MKTRHYALAVLALLLGLAACNKTETGNDDNTDPSQTEEVAVVFTATGLNYTAVTATASTRATVDGNWEGVTSVAVMVDGTMKEYAVSSAGTSATLSSDDPFYWSTSYDNISVTAWWPYTAGDTTLPDVVVEADQSTSDSFAGSDFISAEEQTVAYSNPTLTFTHRTARVTVNLEPGEGFTSVDGATVSLTGLSTENGNPSTIATYNAGSDTYEALTAPQTVAAGTTFVEVELGGDTFYLSLQNDVVLSADYRYTYTVTVSANGLTLEGSTISDWTEGGGESGEAGELEYVYNESTNTYTVYTANGLLVWQEAVQYDNSLNCTLAADIDMTDVEWSPVSSYTGTFDGGGHTITGLFVSGTSSVGMFGVVSSDGKVQNLTLEDVYVSGSGNYTGGVAGRSEGIVTNCSVSGSIYGASYTGGVLGSNDSGTLIACYSSCTVSGSASVGGVAGENYNGTVTACYSLGSVSGSGNYVGGVVGYGYNTTMTSCYHATGSVSGGNATYTGGLIGANWSTNSTVTACYWNGYSGNGIGDDRGTSSVTLVDGSDVTWSTAVDYMNDAIDTWNNENTDTDKQCDWKYELTGELPTLTK